MYMGVSLFVPFLHLLSAVDPEHVHRCLLRLEDESELLAQGRDGEGRVERISLHSVHVLDYRTPAAGYPVEKCQDLSRTVKRLQSFRPVRFRMNSPVFPWNAC